MTNFEVLTTLRTVFELEELDVDLPADPVHESNFQNDESLLLVGPNFARELHKAALQLGERAVTVAFLDRWAPCHAAGDRACARQFVDEMGLRLYRRPLTGVERDRYLALYDQVTQANEPFSVFVRWATVALIDSPYTVYRSEIGVVREDGRYDLTPYEIATALAYTYTGAPPTGELLQRAMTGAFSDRETVQSTAQSLAWQSDGTPTLAFRQTVSRFAEQWLRLREIPNVGKEDPAFGAAVRQSMREEIQRFLGDVVFDQAGTVVDLLLTPSTFLDGTLATFYGYGDSAAADHIQTARPPAFGVGLLAQGALLALQSSNSRSSPTQRGLFVRHGLLCQPLEPAPGGVDVFPPTDAVTTRGRHEALLEENYCRGCHQFMEPVGFALETFDAVGKARTEEGGRAIDASGWLVSSDGDLRFDGPVELAETLAGLSQTSACVAATVAAFGFGLDPARSSCLTGTDSPRDVPIAELWVALAGSDHFRERVAE